MDFKERFCPLPALIINPVDDTDYVETEININPLKISAWRAAQLTWVDDKARPVYEDIVILYVDGQQHMIKAQVEELFSVLKMFML